MSTEESFKKPEGALLRTRLHIRGAKRRLRQGKVSAGIVTLYDALIFALRWYLHEHLHIFSRQALSDLHDERAMIRVLSEAGVIDDTFDLEVFEMLVEKASHEEMPGFDYSDVLSRFESLMTRLGVMPFDENQLPPEDEATF